MARFSSPNDTLESTEADPNNPANSHQNRQTQDDYDQAFNEIADHPDNSDLQDAGREIADKESSPDSSWINNAGQNPRGKGKKKGKGQWFTKGGPLGLVGGGLIAAALGLGAFAPFNMVTHLMQNVTGVGDSASTALERRFVKAFHNMNNGPDPACDSKKIKCKMGRISNNALRKLEKKGVKACFNDGCTGSNTRRTGYPDKNPTKYQFIVNGKVADEVPVNQLMSFLNDRGNFKYSAQIFGIKGAFNMRVKAFAGKHVASKLYNPFGLKRDGGLADGKNKLTGNASQRLQAINSRIQEKIPALDSLKDRAGNVKTKIESKLNRAKKGGVGYLVAVASCLAPQIPRIIATGVAAVQIAQIMPVAMDTLLSPGSKAQVSGLDVDYEQTQDDAEAVGTALTNRVPRESDGKLSSAVESKYLLAAAGINTAKPAMHKEFTPGYAFLMSEAVKYGSAIEGATKDICDVVLHPATMYAAMATDASVTVLASSTIILGIIKVAASWAIAELVIHLLQGAAGEVAMDHVTELAKNDKIPKAQGEELGDVIGIGAAAFFGASGMSRHLPTLKPSQLAAYESVRQENEAMWRDMTIASLSPFDTSSRYTLLGSIMFNFHMTMMTNNNIVNKLLALMPNPSSLLSTQVGAWKGYTDNYCSYGEDFAAADMFGDSGAGAELPARNMAGLPCTGILPEQVAIETDDAIGLMADTEEWIDADAEIAEGDTIGDLVAKGIIKPDTPLYDFINECSDASTGDYLFMSDSCSVLELAGDPGDSCYEDRDEDGNDVQTCLDSDAEIEGINDPRSTAAMTPFLLDFQIVQSLNGEDDEVPATEEGEASA